MLPALAVPYAKLDNEGYTFTVDQDMEQEAFGEQLDRTSMVNKEPQLIKIINLEGRHDIRVGMR